MKDCSKTLAHSIARDGQIIYERDPGIFAAFQQEKLMSSSALKQLRQEMRERLKQRVQELKK